MAKINSPNDTDSQFVSFKSHPGSLPPHLHSASERATQPRDFINDKFVTKIAHPDDDDDDDDDDDCDRDDDNLHLLPSVPLSVRLPLACSIFHVRQPLSLRLYLSNLPGTKNHGEMIIAFVLLVLVLGGREGQMVPVMSAVIAGICVRCFLPLTP